MFESNNSRSDKISKNIMYGAVGQIVQSAFPFVTRTIFIHTLGMTYLGINGLFTSILSVLSLAELGIGTIMVYSLYKPLANNDTDKIKAYVNYYKTIYRIIAAFIFFVGLLLVPFLHHIINLPKGISNIKLYYILYVANSAVSYLYVYKSAVLNADQKEYIISLYTTVSVIVLNIVQCIVLLLSHSFFAYLFLQLIFTFALNFALSCKANKQYKLNHSSTNRLSKTEKKDIFSNIVSMLSYKLGGVFLNSTDSIYISVLVDTITVGLYTNYMILESFLNKFINLIYNSLYASVGNIIATESKEKQKFVFDVISMIFIWIATIGFCGYFLAVNDVINMWIGEKYCINISSVFALSLRFYLPIVLYPTWMYRNTAGLFKQTRSILLFTGILNLVLSYPLGRFLGLTGILLATSISRLITSFWYEPVVLYKSIFKSRHYGEYFIKFGISLLIIGITCVLGCYIRLLLSTSVIIRLFCEIVISIVAPSVFYFLMYKNKQEFKYCISFIKRRFNKT